VRAQLHALQVHITCLLGTQRLSCRACTPWYRYAAAGVPEGACVRQQSEGLLGCSSRRAGGRPRTGERLVGWRLRNLYMRPSKLTMSTPQRTAERIRDVHFPHPEYALGRVCRQVGRGPGPASSAQHALHCRDPRRVGREWASPEKHRRKIRTGDWKVTGKQLSPSIIQAECAGRRCARRPRPVAAHGEYRLIKR
jgi:hypothetical protein